MPTFSELPVELIIKIAGGVEDVVALVALRGTCSRIRLATADLFAQNIQSIPWVVAAVAPMVALDRVTGNAAVAGKLRVLRLGSHYIDLSAEDEFLTRLEQAAGSERAAIEEQHSWFDEYAELQHVLAVEGMAGSTLETVVGRLTGLEHVEVTDGESLLRHVARRFNLHPGRECPGTALFEERTGKKFDSKAGPLRVAGLAGGVGATVNNGLGHNFDLLLRVLGATQRPIKSLRVWHEKPTTNADGSAARPGLDHIPTAHLPPLATLLPPSLATSLAPLTTLALMLRYGGTTSPAANANANALAFLPALTRLTPALQDLTLRFDDRAGEEEALANAFRAFVEGAAADGGLTQLRRLELGNVVVRGEDLVRLWGRVKTTVRVVRLREVVLGAGAGWGEVFREMRGMYGLVAFGLGERDDAVEVVRGVGVEFEWLGERWEAAVGGGQGAERAEGVVVFDRGGLEECGACLDGARGEDAERCRRACRHVSVRTSIVLGEMEAERTEGLAQLFAARVLSRGQLEEMRRGRDA